MWMSGYTNQSSITTPSDSNTRCGAFDQYGNPTRMIMPPLPPDHTFNGRGLRTIIPKPSTSASIPITPSCFNHVTSHSHHLLMGVVEQGGRRDLFNEHQPVVVSSRWNPTPEQLRALEELYRRGTRTPSAVQIQHITSQLRRYGKVEGKNVFYWFQNHKARERQKRRRQQLENSSSSNDQQQSQDHHYDHQIKELALGDESNHNDNKGSTTGFEIEQTNLWTAPTNCSTLADKEAIHKPEKAAAECLTDDEWIQIQDHQNSLLITSATIFQDRAEEPRRRRTSLSLLAKNNTCDNTHHSPSTSSFTNPTMLANEANFEYQDDQGNNTEGALTLELFPLQRKGVIDLIKDDDGKNGMEDQGTLLTSYRFIEFLPLKNNTAH